MELLVASVLIILSRVHTVWSTYRATEVKFDMRVANLSGIVFCLFVLVAQHSITIVVIGTVLFLLLDYIESSNRSLLIKYANNEDVGVCTAFVIPVNTKKLIVLDKTPYKIKPIDIINTCTRVYLGGSVLIIFVLVVIYTVMLLVNMFI